MRVQDVLDNPTPYVPPTAAAEWLLAAHPDTWIDALGQTEDERYVVAMALQAEAAELGERITTADLRDTLRALYVAQDAVWFDLTGSHATATKARCRESRELACQSGGAR